jgi:hypothetical protein
MGEPAAPLRAAKMGEPFPAVLTINAAPLPIDLTRSARISPR